MWADEAVKKAEEALAKSKEQLVEIDREALHVLINQAKHAIQSHP